MSRTKIDGKQQVKEKTVDLGRLEDDFLKSTHWDINLGSETPATITGIPDPIEPLDVVNKQYLEAVVGGAAGIIGEAEDGTYTDGLFTDFVDETPIGTAVDRFNELLKALAPAPAPNLSAISSGTSGATGKLSFGASNAIEGYTNVPSMNVGGQFTNNANSGTRRGILNASTSVTGTLASNVTPSYTNSRPHPNLAFGDADKGFLHLVVNGDIVHTVNLTTYASGQTLNGDGSGFNLSAANAVQFDNGSELDLFQYRTGTFVVHPNSMRNGYNLVVVSHEYAVGLTRDTNIIDWVVDDAVTNTSYAGTDLYDLQMAGSKHISGVEYNLSGTAKFDVTISNPYRNTFSHSNTAISFNGTRCSATALNLSNPLTEADDVAIVARSVSVATGSRILNQDISLRASTLRTLQGTVNSPYGTLGGILLDATTANSTNAIESMNDERFRLHTGIDIENTSYGSGPNASSYDWDSEQSLVGANGDHNTGLLVANGSLSYPSSTGHITGINNGNFVVDTIPTNVNYSSASGNRTFLRYFYDASARQNFTFNLDVVNTSFVSVASGVSGNALTFELLAPNTTKDSEGAVVWKDAVVPHNGNDTDIGCYASTFGGTVPTNWGCTIGSQNTSTSGNVIVIRITAPASWTGRINSISITYPN